MKNRKFIIKIILTALIILFVTVSVYFLLQKLGVNDISREKVQAWVEKAGAFAPLAFIFISFIQVTFIPIPAVITILAGSYIFGAWLSFLYSYIGMMIGGVFGFYLGRGIGRPLVNFLAGGKDVADGWIKRLKGKETVFLFFAFLLPFFPDDLLCSVAGVLSVKFYTFLIMQIITRATSIGATLIFASGEIIPFHGWGLIVLSALALTSIIAFILCIKHADKLNAQFDKLSKRISERVKNKKAK